MKTLIKVTAALFLVMLAGHGCSDGGKFMLGEINKEKSQEIRHLIETELPTGSTSDEIKDFFERNSISYSYDRFMEKYHGIIRDVASDPKVDQAVEIDIYLDKEGKLKAFKVEDTYTGL